MPLQNPVEVTVGTSKTAISNNVPCDSADLEGNIKDNASGEHVQVFLGDVAAPLTTLVAKGGSVNVTGLSNLNQLKVQATAADQKLTIRPYLT